MAEIKVDCPVCFSTDKCFEDTVEDKKGNEFKSYMCFRCGYTSNTAYKWDTPELKNAQLGATQLMNEVALYDEDREIMWFPSIVNMGKLGVIYPEGTKNNWTYKLAQVRQLSESEQKEERYKGHTEILDVENAKEYGQYDFLDACREMGIVKDL